MHHVLKSGLGLPPDCVPLQLRLLGLELLHFHTRHRGRVEDPFLFHSLVLAYDFVYITCRQRNLNRGSTGLFLRGLSLKSLQSSNVFFGRRSGPQILFLVKIQGVFFRLNSARNAEGLPQLLVSLLLRRLLLLLLLLLLFYFQHVVVLHLGVLPILDLLGLHGGRHNDVSGAHFPEVLVVFLTVLRLQTVINQQFVRIILLFLLDLEYSVFRQIWDVVVHF